jgi:hypothetical protein
MISSSSGGRKGDAGRTGKRKVAGTNEGMAADASVADAVDAEAVGEAEHVYCMRVQ